jgi:hypothetical protein
LYALSDCTIAPERPLGRKRVSTANIIPSPVYAVMMEIICSATRVQNSCSGMS